MYAAAGPVDPTAVVGRRIGAWTIDLCIYFLLVPIIALLVPSETAENLTRNSQRSADEYCARWQEDNDGICWTVDDGEKVNIITVADPALALIPFGIHLVGYVVVQGLLGASIGKLAVGLRVVDAEGKQIGLGRSAARTAAWLLDAVTLGLPILGGIVMLASPGHRRIGDMVAGTYVVPRGLVGRPVTIPTSAPGAVPAGWGGPPPPAGGWAPPATGQPGTFESPDSGRTIPSPAPMTDGPIWDPVRDTYIQYDRHRQAWLQWDEARSRWEPIDR